MAVPSLENGPWTFNVNNTFYDPDNDVVGQWSIFTVKEIIASFSAWSVVASSNGIGVRNIGDSSPDLWVAYTSLVEDCWTILENSTTGEQICIHVTDSDFIAIDIYYSATGDYATSGGTIDSPPSVTDYIQIFPRDAGVDFIDDAAVGVSISGMISNDDKCTRVFIRQGTPTSYYGTQVLLFEEAYGSPSVWTSTYKRCVYKPRLTYTSTSGPSQGPQFDYTTRLDALYCYVEHASLSTGYYEVVGHTECYGSTMYTGSGQILCTNTTSLGWVTGGIASPIGLARIVNDHGGLFGKLKDIYMAPTNHDSLDTYPSNGNKDWIKFGCLLVPWNGSSPSEAPTSAPS